MLGWSAPNSGSSVASRTSILPNRSSAALDLARGSCRSRVFSSGVRTRTVSPTSRPFESAQASSTTASRSSSPLRTAGRALHEVERQHPVDRLRVDAGDTDLLALVLARAVGDRRDVRDAVDVAGGRHGVARDRREAVRVLEDHVALEVLVDRLRDRRLEAGGEDGHEGHEREPDHQRGRRGGGAAGLAHRVLAREPAGQPADALHRLAGQRRERPDEPRREQRGARTGSAPRRRRAGRRPCRTPRCRRTARSA